MISSALPPLVSTPKPLPEWKPGNLAEHVNKRVAVDTGCLESVDGLERQLLTGDLRRISESAYLAPSLVYECESVDDGARFRERRAHFVDLKKNPSASLLILERHHRIFTSRNEPDCDVTRD